jgi:predicted site-specific integrase-resolvase
MTTIEAPKTDRIQWITKRDAYKLLNVAPETLALMIRDGILSIQRLPHARPRLRRDEVERLLSSYTTPATSGPVVA